MAFVNTFGKLDNAKRAWRDRPINLVHNMQYTIRMCLEIIG